MIREAAYEPAVRSYVRSYNSRSGVAPGPGQSWVRIRPPTEEEIVDEAINPKLVRFHRLGAAATVLAATRDFVELSCAGEVVMTGYQDFADSWVRLVTEDNWRI